jgi:hypothetical protein
LASSTNERRQAMHFMTIFTLALVFVLVMFFLVVA